MSVSPLTEGNKGTWNSIRETIVCSMTDLDGRDFQLRLLVDPGATVSSLPAHTLWYTKAKWECEQIRPICISGVNSITHCDLICHAAIKPGRHLSKEFKEIVSVANNFQINVDFFVMRGPTVYTTYKHEMPKEIRSTLSKNLYYLADPEQIAPRDTLLYIHGILGVQAIMNMKRQSFEPVPNAEMTTCRSLFGDLLFGTSHFIEDRPVPTDPPMNDTGIINSQYNTWCSDAWWERGMCIDNTTEEFKNLSILELEKEAAQYEFDD